MWLHDSERSYGEYGIVANVVEADRCFRLGARAWLAGGTGGEGWHRFAWMAKTRGGRYVRKWTMTLRFGNFRCAWIPEHLVKDIWYMTGTREEVERMAKELEAFVAEQRLCHPNRPERYRIDHEKSKDHPCTDS